MVTRRPDHPLQRAPDLAGQRPRRPRPHRLGRLRLGGTARGDRRRNDPLAAAGAESGAGRVSGGGLPTGLRRPDSFVPVPTRQRALPPRRSGFTSLTVGVVLRTASSKSTQNLLVKRRDARLEIRRVFREARRVGSWFCSLSHGQLRPAPDDREMSSQCMAKFRIAVIFHGRCRTPSSRYRGNCRSRWSMHGWCHGRSATLAMSRANECNKEVAR